MRLALPDHERDPRTTNRRREARASGAAIGGRSSHPHPHPSTRSNPTSYTLTLQVGAAIHSALRNLRACLLSAESAGGARWPSHIEGVLDWLDAYAPFTLPYLTSPDLT